jgi:hypothetical protein
MSTRLFALILGVVFVVAGLAGFIPQLVPDGLLLGLFPVNAPHNIVHLAFGVWGVSAYFGSGARLFAQATAIIYGVVTILGLIPATHDVFGLMPVHGNDIWLHAVIAVVAAYFGFRSEVAARDATIAEPRG